MGKTISLRTIAVAALTAVLAMSLFAGAAMAQNGNGKGNSARSVAQPVELAAEDISAQMCQNGEDVQFYAVEHGLGSEFGDADDIVWREPARLGGENVSVGGGAWDTLYLGVSGPECGDIQHKGQVSVYYYYGDDVYSIIAQFNGQGELLWVNGVEPEA